MNTKILFTLLVFLPFFFISCSDDNEPMPGKNGNCTVTVVAGGAEYKYSCVYDTKTEGSLEIMTLTTEDVKDNADYGIFTGAKITFMYKLQGTGIYEVVSAKRLDDGKENDKRQISMYVELGDKSKTYSTYQSWSGTDHKVGITENEGKYYILVSEPVKLSYSGGIGAGTSSPDVPQVIEIKMQMHL